MAAKKKTDDPAKQATRKRKLVEDPPVIVGGGNSLYVYVKNTATPITPVMPGYIPGYLGFRLGDNIQVLRVADGMSPRIKTIPLRPDVFGTNFDLS